MATKRIIGLACTTNVRISSGVNGEYTTSPGIGRKGAEDITFEAGPNGVTLARASGYASLVPWPTIVQVFFEDEAPRAAKVP